MTNIRPALLGKLPTGDGNGLTAVTGEMSREPGRIRVGIVLFDADRLTERTDDGDHEIRARIRRIEVITDAEDSGIMERILTRQYERRTGQTTLPFELEADVKDAFADVGEDPEDEDPEDEDEPDDGDQEETEQLPSEQPGLFREPEDPEPEP